MNICCNECLSETHSQVLHQRRFAAATGPVQGVAAAEGPQSRHDTQIEPSGLRRRHVHGITGSDVKATGNHIVEQLHHVCRVRVSVCLLPRHAHGGRPREIFNCATVAAVEAEQGVSEVHLKQHARDDAAAISCIQ